MKSIRIFLIVSLIATITLLNFLTALRGYQKSMREAEKIFDGQLLEYVKILSRMPETIPEIIAPESKAPETIEKSEVPSAIASAKSVGGNGGIDWTSNFSEDSTLLSKNYHSLVTFQIWREGNNPVTLESTENKLVLLGRSSDAPVEPISTLVSGYNNVNFSGYRWRTLVIFQTDKNRWLMAAQRDDIRYQLAEKVIIESVLPTVIVLPAAGLMIWLIVGFGLAPIRHLASALRAKEVNDLSPVNSDMPMELAPLINSTNDLLVRLDASFKREKRFASDAAHELRTPISALKIHYQNLLNENLEHSGSLQPLGEGIERMEHLVEQVLLLNRTVPEQYMANFELLDLYVATQKVILENYSSIEAKEQQIELQGQAGNIKGDKFAIHTLIHNLLSNAIKYTPKGGNIIIRIMHQDNQVIFDISDSGPGIPSTEYERVFDRFYRIGGDQHDSKTIGCGLGLAIVKHIVELHGADMLLGKAPTINGLSVTIKFSQDGYSL